MKILTLTENFLVGGLETRLKSLKKAFRILDVENHIYAANIKKDSSVNKLPIKRKNGIYEISRDNIKAISDVILKLNPDVIDIQPFITIELGGMAAIYCQKPYVLTIHGKPTIDHISTSSIAKFVVLNASHVFCVSSSLLSEFKKKFPNINCSLSLNCIDSSIDIIVKKSNQFDSMLIVSRLDTYKASAVENFINIVSRTTVFRNEIKCIDVIGGGTELIRLKEIALKKNLKINFLGEISNASERMKNYSIVGGVGRVIIESASIGVPSLIVDYNGIAGFLDKKNYAAFSKLNFVRISRRITSPELDEEFIKLKNYPQKYICDRESKKYNDSKLISEDLYKVFKNIVSSKNTLVFSRINYESVSNIIEELIDAQTNVKLLDNSLNELNNINLLQKKGYNSTIQSLVKDNTELNRSNHHIEIEYKKLHKQIIHLASINDALTKRLISYENRDVITLIRKLATRLIKIFSNG